MKLVIVEWEDSATYTGWHHLSGSDKFSNCVSVGLLCQEDKKQVILAMNKSDSGTIGDAIAIPKRSIRRIRYLKVK